MSQHKENEFKPPVADMAPVVEDLDGFNCAINPMERLISPWADKTGFSSEKEDLKTWLKVGGGKVYPATGEAIEKSSRKTQRNNNLRLALQYCNDPEKQEKEEEKSGKNLKRIFWIQKAQHSKALANRINNLASQIIQSDPELTKKEKENLKKRLISKLRVASDPPAVSQTTSSSEKQDSKDDATQAALPEVNNKAGIIKTPIGFTCPLTGDLIKEPYLAADGYSYEKKAIEKHLQNSNVSPVTRERLENKDLVKNWNLFKAIQDFQAKWMPFSQHQKMIARVEKEANDIRAKRAQQKELRQTKQVATNNPLPNLQSNVTTAMGGVNVTEQKPSPDRIAALAGEEQFRRTVINGDLQAVEGLLKKKVVAHMRDRDILSTVIQYSKDSQIFQYLWSVDNFHSAGVEYLHSLDHDLIKLIGLHCSWNVKDKEEILAKLSRYGNVPPLLQAACVGNIEIIKERLSDSKQQPITVPDLLLIFWFACANGHEDIMALLWSHRVVSKISLESSTGTALNLAAENGQLGAVKYLLDLGIKIEGCNKSHARPLILALNNNQVDVVKLLLERGVTLNEGLERVFPKLLMMGVNCTFTETDHVANALLSVESFVYKDMVLLLLDYWVKLTKKNTQFLQADKDDADGNTPLMLAALQGDVEKVSSLLSAGETLEKSNKRQQTALLLAAYGGHVRVLELLLDSGASIHAIDMMGVSFLMAAVSSGKIEVVEVLLKRIVASKPEVGRLWICFAVALAKITSQPAVVKLLAEFAGPAVLRGQSSAPQPDVPTTVSSSSISEQKHVKQDNSACPVTPNKSSFFTPPQHQQANRRESKEMLQPQFLQKDAATGLQTVKDSSSSSGEVMHSSTSEHH